MITVHHLNASRSMRVLWLLEELGLEYRIIRYSRDPQTNLAPPEMRPVSPVGKSPTVEDGYNGGRLVFESGAIIEYLVRNYDRQNALAPKPTDPEYDDYVRWLHYAESSAMLPVMLSLYMSRLAPGADKPVRPRISGELANHFGYISGHLEGREFLVGDGLTGADVQMAFAVEAAHKMGLVESFPNLGEYYGRLQARPAFERAMKRAGEEPLKPFR
ncbi:glutathione S-transferase family protein [Rubrobacter indicoceani]|uniref:glutathione S-transferase family protein n=1 Tax=Rubrobacter indicoceani TaxID=2051957 RepID=UPI000E5C2241|nr:glutathione S-transferase [Rubrobacter indicoceani]